MFNFEQIVKVTLPILKSKVCRYTTINSLGVCKCKCECECDYGCGVDVDHFGKAMLSGTVIPKEIARLTKPVFGFFGVVDERSDPGWRHAEPGAEAERAELGAGTGRPGQQSGGQGQGHAVANLGQTQG